MARKIPYLDTAQGIGRVVNGTIVLEPWFVDAWNDLLNRAGGQTTNAIASSVITAAQAQATTAALAAGAVTTGYTLTPSNPVSIVYGGSTATLVVAAHERNEGGSVATLPSGTVGTPVPRGATYYVFYDTPYVDAPVYEASVNPGVLTPASVKLIATVAVLSPETVGGSTGVNGGGYLDFTFDSNGLRI